MGVICSTLIFSTVLCFVAICNRCKATDAETDKEGIILEAVKQEHDQSVMKSDEGLEEQDPLQVQTPAEVSTNTSAVYRGTEEERKILEKEQTLTEVDYASINYSLLQKNDDGDLKPKKVESDYAEIQLKKVNEEEAVQTMQDEMKNSGEAQDGAKQDGVDHDLEGGMESQKQEELEEVQV
ncbi:hypothetical protein QTP70_015218 [Hemibagrus guttatus]|uniref:Uncharacterized protein n=1 Tax=Hemibagrus guttatus TaxID=175788 RepID=A0AAE0QRZ9_9TELE|nr:hypothetical protein QTP70_015218 [Hemibagrus guttatus]